MEQPGFSSEAWQLDSGARLPSFAYSSSTTDQPGR